MFLATTEALRCLARSHQPAAAAAQQLLRVPQEVADRAAAAALTHPAQVAFLAKEIQEVANRQMQFLDVVAVVAAQVVVVLQEPNLQLQVVAAAD
jgi:hypothetical protein